MPQLLCHGASIYTCNCHIRGPLTLTLCPAFLSGPVTTCLNDFGLLQMRFEHLTFRLQGELSDPLRHR